MPASWLSVGGLVFQLSAEDGLAPAERSLTRAFAVEPGVADLRIHARWTDAPLTLEGQLTFDGGESWQLHTLADERIITCCTAVPERRIYKQARFDAAFRQGEVVVSRRFFSGHAERIDPLDYPLDEVVTIHALAHGRGVAVHACGALDAEGRAYVFAGQSGAGKSTLARLLAEAPVVAPPPEGTRADGPWWQRLVDALGR